MRRLVPIPLLLALVPACGPAGDAASGDTAAAPDTAAIRGAESAPHPTPAEVDSLDSAAMRDSVR